MAGTTGDFSNGGQFYLDPTQQDLLLAALASNTQNPSHNDLQDNSQFQYPMNPVDPAFFTSPQQSTPANAFGNLPLDDSPYVDYIDGDSGFDIDNIDTKDLMIGALPGDSPTGQFDSDQKRKNPDDDGDDDDEEGGGKRREGDDKQAKKPGRKPLTSEPTTKRKAQNRAAQRAFRERKEKHLKDLETKVQELEKASDATNQENGLLRAQVQRLQTELREYRKRLSSSGTTVNRTPSFGNGLGSMLNSSSNFSFEFPRFGGLPGTQLLDNKTKPSSVSTATTGNSSRQGSTTRVLSPGSQGTGSVTESPGPIGFNAYSNGVQRNNSLNGYFGTSNSPNTGTATRASTQSPATAQSRVFQFNSGSSTHSDSPSSSTSPAAQDSSCGTSPEPSHQSPQQAVLNTTKSPTPFPNGIDYYASQNGGQFDPTLFGEYRDTQNAIVGDGDFTGGFFNDAFLNVDYASPFHFGDTPAVQKPNPLEEIERIQDGDDEVVPGEDVHSMLNCHKIWDKLSSRSDFKDGTIDIDNLCSELRAKARCSESGVVVDHKDVEAALGRLPQDKIAS